jgi:hypothetical protein
MRGELLYTTEHIGSGQFAKCSNCGKLPTLEGHDGCLGELDTGIVMNACCGHGDEYFAYVQYWDKSCIRGREAVVEIERLRGKLEV